MYFVRKRRDKILMRRNITNYEDESVNKGNISTTWKVVYLEIRDLHV